MSQFFREFLRGRGKFDPRDSGVDMEREKFMDLIVDEFSDKYRGNWTIDELVLHPREASMFCDGSRHKHGWLYVPGYHSSLSHDSTEESVNETSKPRRYAGACFVLWES
jgi:hypothetical protein